MDKPYIEKLEREISELHQCTAHYDTVGWIEEAEGNLRWSGFVVAFNLTGHPTADRCYAWAEAVPENQGGPMLTMLGIPPVVSAETAVRARLISRLKSV
jgi:hypothetical protein